MAEILNGEFFRNETNQNSMGGTERLAMELVSRANPELLKEFQIVCSRIRNELQEDKIRIFWAHDLPNDPESTFLRDKNMVNKFHLFVFVSNWQMQAYINAYQIPWSKCVVILNAIEPIESHEKPTDKINFIYHTTPHRGLHLLVPVFDRLCEKYDNIHLDVYSSFGIYGWEERDEQYKSIFEMIDEHPNMTNHGSVPHEEVREALKNAHVFAYPSIWPETSCMSLMESMSAGLLCIHSNFAALPETAANWTQMYQMHEDQVIHAGSFYNMIEMILSNWEEESIHSSTPAMQSYANIFYGWKTRVNHWESMMRSMIRNVQDRSFPKEMFNYKI